jgi:hypothetical protein
MLSDCIRYGDLAIWSTFLLVIGTFTPSPISHRFEITDHRLTSGNVRRLTITALTTHVTIC